MINNSNKQDKPLVLISRCLGFKPCRYDGSIIEFNQLKELKKSFILKPICPEVAAGLGVPRPPVKLVVLNNWKEVGYLFNNHWQIKPNILRNVIRKYLRDYNNAGGMILKEKSPSCGIKRCKYYKPPGRDFKGRTGGILIEEYNRLNLGWPLIDEISLQSNSSMEKFIADVKKFHNKDR